MPKGRGFRRKHLMSKKQPSHTLVTNVDSLQKRCNEALKSVAGHQKSVDTLLGCASRDPSTLMQTRMYLHTRPQPSPPDNLNPDTSLQDLQKLDELVDEHISLDGVNAGWVQPRIRRSSDYLMGFLYQTTLLLP